MFTFLQMKTHCRQEHLRGLTCLLRHMAPAFHDKTGLVWRRRDGGPLSETLSVTITPHYAGARLGLFHRERGKK